MLLTFLDFGLQVLTRPWLPGVAPMPLEAAQRTAGAVLTPDSVRADSGLEGQPTATSNLCCRVKQNGGGIQKSSQKPQPRGRVPKSGTSSLVTRDPAPFVHTFGCLWVIHPTAHQGTASVQSPEPTKQLQGHRVPLDSQLGVWHLNSIGLKISIVDVNVSI